MVAAAVAAAAWGVSSSHAAAQTASERNQYRLEFEVTPDIAAAGAHVELRLSQTRRQLRKLTMRFDPERIQDVRGDGGLRIDGDVLTWVPAQRGGSLRWFASLRHQRGSKNYDAYLDTDWAVFRGEDVIPRASTRTVKDAMSETWLSFRLPVGWSSTTPYFGKDDRYRVNNPERRFDLPAGWIALGRLGVRYEAVGKTRVKVAGPLGHGIRRMDTLSFLHWTLPEFQRLLPSFPKRITIISAAAPMWRGGLSGPRSLFIHADLPLISENSTSTLLHEIFHVAFAPYQVEQADWIIEGLSEYYGIMILSRTGGISDKRLKQALDFQAEWGKTTARLCSGDSSGPITARAVTVLSMLDDEIRRETRNRHSLDDVTRDLASGDVEVTLNSLRKSAAKLIGTASESLLAKNLPGCEE
ncbi:MAG TPA: hypothetical protein VLB07_16335 [Woeseiaceae bacterium]|nr:hypothetical protein [Woeseiaceae bacterium]